MIKLRHYVYAHLLNGEIKYVGIGRNTDESDNYYRAYNFEKTARTAEWFEVFSSEKPEVVILEDNLSYTDAIYLENYIFHSCRDNLVNICEPRPNRELDFDLFNEHFYVDETSPSGLRLKSKHRNNSRQKVGDVVGTHTTPSRASSNKVYWRVKLNSVGYLAHRIVYLLTYGSIDSEMVINHIDGNGLNNKIENLEQVSQRVNSYKRIRKDNNVGHPGISYCYYKGKVDAFLANCSNKKQRFSIISFGTESEALEAAIRWRKYQEHINGLVLHSNFEDLKGIVYKDLVKIHSVRRSPTPWQLSNGEWYLKFKLNNKDKKYICLSGFKTKEEIEAERDRIVSEFNANLIINI